MLLFYIFTSALNSFVWSVLADYLLLLNTKFYFIFWSSAEFITLSLGKNPSVSPPLSPLTFSVLSQYSTVQSFLLTVHTLFTSYSPLPSSFNISLWIPVTLPSHPSFFPPASWSVAFFLHSFCYETVPTVFHENNIRVFQQFSSYFSDSGWVGRVRAEGKSLIITRNDF